MRLNHPTSPLPAAVITCTVENRGRTKARATLRSSWSMYMYRNHQVTASEQSNE